MFTERFPFLDADTHLPMLEFLCLQEVNFKALITFPTFPRLHTVYDTLLSKVNTHLENIV